MLPHNFQASQNAESRKNPIIEAQYGRIWEKVFKHHTSGRSVAQIIPGYGEDSIEPLTNRSLNFFRSLTDHQILDPILEIALACEPGDDVFLDQALQNFPGMKEISARKAVCLFPALRPDRIPVVGPNGPINPKQNL